MRLLTRTRRFFSLENEFHLNFLQPHFTQLTDRTLIIVAGPDTYKFLQGLTTNNIQLLNPPKNNHPHNKTALYTLFLNPKGKVVSDALIIQPRIFEGGKIVPKQEQLWIEVDRQYSTTLSEHLRKYSFKKKVLLANLAHEEEQPKLFAGFTPIVLGKKQNEEMQKIKKQAGNLVHLKERSHQQGQDGEYCNLAYFDPRFSFLGIRIVCGAQGFSYKKNTQFTTLDNYHSMLKKFGITSTKAMNNKLPFMFNTDLLNGFSFRKGCYLGQELISRSYFTGIVRRRIFPFQIDSPEILPSNTVLKDENGTEVGKVLEGHEGGGLAISNYLGLMEREWPIRIKEPGEGWIGSPLQEELREYVQQMRKKQSKLLQIDL